MVPDIPDSVISFVWLMYSIIYVLLCKCSAYSFFLHREKPFISFSV